MKQYGNPDTLAAAPGQVLYEKDAQSGVAWITLNRPEKHNAMTVPMRARLSQLVKDAEQDNDVAVIVLRGNGKSFCSGNQIDEDWGHRPGGQKRMTLTTASRYSTEMMWGRHSFTQVVSRCTKIVMLQLHGYCAAAAYFTLATRCDIVLVSEDAKIGALEGRFLGPASTVAGIHINRILGTKAARRVGYTAEPISGDEAYALGLAHLCMPVSELAAATDALAREIAARPRPLLRYLKARVLSGEAVFDTSVPTITGLLYSHFLQTAPDEKNFWATVKSSGVAGALSDDKARRTAAVNQLKEKSS